MLRYTGLISAVVFTLGLGCDGGSTTVTPLGDTGADSATDSGKDSTSLDVPTMDAPGDRGQGDGAAGDTGADGAVTEGGGDAAEDTAAGDGATGDGATGDAGCPDGGTACMGACVDTRTSVAHCGGCGMACALANATANCVAGACAVGTCMAGFADCDMMAANGCEVNLNATAAHCGACGRACSPANAVGACMGGACAIDMCMPGFGDCNDMVADGCETDTGSRVMSCGACGRACVTARGTPACMLGRCATATCDTGFGDCDMMAANGCEAQLNTNTNCGACGRACALGTRCSDGLCVSSCPTGTTFCLASLICARTENDVANCGACDSACPARAHATATCAMSACGFTCDAGFADCDRMAANGCETDLNGTASACGTCTNACMLAHATAACTLGRCTVGACEAGFADCNGNPADGCEVNTNTTPTACGACGSACSVPNAVAGCAAGRCTVGTCNPGFANCNAMVADGCETNTNSNTNCGGCGVVCAAGTRCAGGACVSSCPAGTTFCAATSVCADLNTDTNNCGLCGTVCFAVANASPRCADGGCSFTCNAGFADCDGVASNGCEVNLGSSVGNCGGCGNACRVGNATAACTAGTCTVLRCNAGFGDCNGNPADGCEVDLNTTTSSCGLCGNVCAPANATPSCAAGVCGIASCDTGFGDCDRAVSNGCEAPLTTNSNCGMCGRTCGAGSFCSGGTCTTMCTMSTRYCAAAMACFNLATDVNNCGSCGNVCPTRANSTPTCTSGTCGIACNAGFADCDGEARNGCEVNIASSPSNCGACGTVCRLANATAGCTSGRCTVASCNSGFGDCNGIASDGCESNLNTSVNNCSVCGLACSLPNAVSSCSGGSCTIAMCNTGFGDCNRNPSDGCERALNTNTNCGSCGTRCADGQVCSSGTCVSSCPAGTTFCMATGSCVNLNTNPDNCGRCGNVCPSAPHVVRTCMAGTCTPTCEAGYGNCDMMSGNGCETNLQNSVNNCGACRTVCRLANATSTCTAGTCAIATCNLGFANCNGTASDGCEVNLLSDNNNCGTCGAVCRTGLTCRFGRCLP